MKTKINLFVFILIIISLFNFPRITKAQEEMDFEEFMGMMSQTFTEDQLDQISYQIPWDVKVTAYAYGDFSGHGNNDIVIALKEKDVTPPGTVDVYFLESLGDTAYTVADVYNYQYYDLDIEVAFMVKDGVCYVTHRDKTNWYFTSFQIDDNDSLEITGREVYPIENVENAGK